MMHMQYYLNNLLIIPVLARCYVIYRFFISCTVFYDERADRITKMFGGILSRVFAIKCMLHLYPFHIIVVFSLSITFILSYMIRIFECGTHVLHDGTTEYINVFGSLSDSFYYLWITYATSNIGF
jgi:hypothetical protein